MWACACCRLAPSKIVLKTDIPRGGISTWPRAFLRTSSRRARSVRDQRDGEREDPDRARPGDRPILRPEHRTYVNLKADLALRGEGSAARAGTRAFEGWRSSAPTGAPPRFPWRPRSRSAKPWSSCTWSIPCARITPRPTATRARPPGAREVREGRGGVRDQDRPPPGPSPRWPRS